MVIETTSPSNALDKNGEYVRTKNPTMRTIEETQSAVPTVSKLYLTESSALRFRLMRACRYFVSICTVASTISPIAVAVTKLVQKPTSVWTKLNTPKATTGGAIFGIRLISPRRRLRRASIKHAEMSKNATSVPCVMASKLRRPM